MNRPQHEPQDPQYAFECREALTPLFNLMVEQAQAAGWTRAATLQALSQLAEDKKIEREDDDRQLAGF